MKKIIFSLSVFFLFVTCLNAQTVRVVQKSDGSVAIIYPAPNSKRNTETEEQWLERVFAEIMQGRLKGLPYYDIDSSELLQTRKDRNSWEFDEVEKKVKVNQIKAKQIRDAKEREEKIKLKIREIAERELE